MHKVLCDITSRNIDCEAVTIRSICTKHENVLRIALSCAQKLNASIELYFFAFVGTKIAKMKEQA